MSGEQRNFVCGLCRYQRRRHDGSCHFGQYFPSNRLTEIESACKLFGLANLLRLMRCAEPSERQVMANSILREAKMWANDPIHGALGQILTLSNHIQAVEKELELVDTILAQCSHQATPQIATTDMDVDSSSDPGQSSTVGSHEKEGAAPEKDKDAEIQEKE